MTSIRHWNAAGRHDLHHTYPGSRRHRPVPRELIVQQFAGWEDLPLDRVLALGAEDYQGGDPSKFNMAVMCSIGPAGQRGVCAARLGVTGDVPGLWRSFDTSEVPISSITNGVHHLTWVHRELLDLLEAPTGIRERWLRLECPEKSTARRSGRSSGGCART